MSRRSRAGSEPVKTRRRKTVAPKRHKGPKAVRDRGASLQAKVARLTHERDEALEQLIATSEVLGVISRTPTDVQPVFDFIAKSGVSLCTSRYCDVFQFDRKFIHFVVIHA